MDEKLDRRELPIQWIKEFEIKGLDDLTATVPVHLKILQLPIPVRTDKLLLAGAIETIKAWFNEDMAYHLNSLESDGSCDPRAFSLVREYERFNDNWAFEWLPDNAGFLALTWRDNGRVDRMCFCKTPVVLYNQWDENRQFYTPKYILENNFMEGSTRSLKESQTVFMEPEKMKKYGIESELARIDVERGVAEVQGHAFCSDYQPNMGKALLLRDFAVFYLNKLLDKTSESSI